MADDPMAFLVGVSTLCDVRTIKSTSKTLFRGHPNHEAWCDCYFLNYEKEINSYKKKTSLGEKNMYTTYTGMKSHWSQKIH